jgi:hypothetical protein
LAVFLSYDVVADGGHARNTKALRSFFTQVKLSGQYPRAAVIDADAHTVHASLDLYACAKR